MKAKKSCHREKCLGRKIKREEFEMRAMRRMRERDTETLRR